MAYTHLHNIISNWQKTGCIEENRIRKIQSLKGNFIRKEVSQNREIPIAEALRHQIEVQKRLEEQLDIIVDLAQGKYLHAVLEKAQRTLSMEGSGNNLEASRAQFIEFNSALSNFMKNMNNKDSKQSISYVNDFYSKVHGSGFHNYHEVIRREENIVQTPKIEEARVKTRKKAQSIRTNRDRERPQRVGMANGGGSVDEAKARRRPKDDESATVA
ncbi:hypothetical protein Ahy_B10g104015 [Arachis hypogaea]|uniref:MYB-CC type transcription factor LHEQLE-containing domain-containing protein n=1 Tax=Arachis hypogaea TaxID=3818 RepID=A0A444X4I8_ARAHY|nr:hypothetical protein Ahy_B10g104015 [Arachis hypogaea]